MIGLFVHDPKGNRLYFVKCEQRRVIFGNPAQQCDQYSLRKPHVFLMNPEEVTCQDECLIGQFTISDDISTNIIINVQGRKINEDPLNMNDNAWTEYNIVFPINSKTGPHLST